MIASPIIYPIVRKTSFGIISLTILYIGLSKMAIFYYFSLGAYFAVQGKDFVAMSRKWLGYALIIAAFSLVVRMLTDGLLYVEFVYIISAMIVAVAWADKYLSVICIPESIIESSFFLFCYHTLPLLMLCKIGISFLIGKSEIFWIIDFFLNPFIVILGGVLLYKMLRRYMPWLLAVIIGGR